MSGLNSPVSSDENIVATQSRVFYLLRNEEHGINLQLRNAARRNSIANHVRVNRRIQR
jgi:hypothetical protein